MDVLELPRKFVLFWYFADCLLAENVKCNFFQYEFKSCFCLSQNDSKCFVWYCKTFLVFHLLQEKIIQKIFHRKRYFEHWASLGKRCQSKVTNVLPLKAFELNQMENYWVNSSKHIPASHRQAWLWHSFWTSDFKPCYAWWKSDLGCCDS